MSVNKASCQPLRADPVSSPPGLYHLYRWEERTEEGEEGPLVRVPSLIAAPWRLRESTVMRVPGKGWAPPGASGQR